eukprot:COSAG05_NODE_3606_length_1963_cov_68.999515_1_plen_60_part_10
MGRFCYPEALSFETSRVVLGQARRAVIHQQNTAVWLYERLHMRNSTHVQAASDTHQPNET